MAEIAGLVLGGIPLIFLALDKYQECLEQGRNYCKYNDMLLDIRTEVFVQQKQFYNTIELLGLYEPTYNELDQYLQVHFPEEYMQFARYIKKMDTTVKQLMEKLEIDVQDKQSQNVSSRVGWEWRRVKRSLATKERRKLFDELQHSNDVLGKLLMKPKILLEDSTPMVRSFAARYNQHDCDAVRVQASDVKKALDACWHCSCLGLHRTSLDLDWQTNKPTNTPVFGVSLSYLTRSGQSTASFARWRKARLRIDAADTRKRAGVDEEVLGPPMKNLKLSVGPSQPTSLRQQARLLFVPSLSRKLSTTPPPPPVGNALANSPPLNSTAKIESLCRFVQEPENGGRSLGFMTIPGETRRVHLESFPGARTEEVTLTSLLPPSKPPAHLKMGRRKRFEIATAAAWATLLLCDTPWLSQNWDKHGLCFFSDNVPNTSSPLASRCVSMTQGCTQSSQPNQTSTATLHNKLIRNGAVFALGILLIELCLNRSFDEDRKAASVGNTITTVVDDFDIADSLIEDVFNEGGEPYGNAVQRCIRFAFPGRDTAKNFSHMSFRQDFHNLVVAPIEATLSTVPL
ncbi:hypothetical protein D6D06_07784 [Aureobasidium pullulans]|nr:hypothetical protein D6D06_07784 [Aureobasidium pullulans]